MTASLTTMAALVAGVVVLTSACGQKGPLIPPPAQAAPATASAASAGAR